MEYIYNGEGIYEHCIFFSMIDMNTWKDNHNYSILKRKCNRFVIESHWCSNELKQDLNKEFGEMAISWIPLVSETYFPGIGFKTKEMAMRFKIKYSL